jgi:flagellar biosynthetic protein FlhB
MAPQENEAGQEKTERATSRRREKNRSKGSVAKSQEVNSAVVLFFAVAILALYGPHLGRELTGYVRYSFTHFHEIDLTRDSFQIFAADRLFFFFKLVAPIFLVFIVVGVVSNLLQFGWLFTSQTVFQGLKNFSLSPVKLFKKIFSLNTLIKTVTDILKLSVLVGLVYKTLKTEMVKFPSLVSIPINEAIQYMVIMLFKLALQIIVFLFLIGILDFIWQKIKHEKSMKMTKVEVKDEMKQVEGDPKIRQQIRSAQFKMMVSHMVKKVPEADVVITNPFHIAIAIKFDAKVMSAPTVIAKGARLIAERIKDAARNASVPIIENKPLAQTIYKTIDVGEEIPPKLYQAIAEILAYVYKLNKDRTRQYASI